MKSPSDEELDYSSDSSECYLHYQFNFQLTLFLIKRIMSSRRNFSLMFFANLLPVTKFAKLRCAKMHYYAIKSSSHCAI